MSNWRLPGLTMAAVMLAAACGAAATPAPTSAPTAGPTAAPSEQAQATLDPNGPKVTIRLLNAFPAGNVFNGPPDLYVKTVEEKSGGRITFNVDGPEVVPYSEGIQALGNGVYDLHYNVPLFHTGTVPAGEAIYFISGNSSCQAYRDAGALDIYDQIHREQANVAFFACGGGGAHGATFLLKDPIEKIDDLKGKKLRGFGLYTRVLDKLGASSVALAPGDIYNAIERGVVDGAAFPNLGIIDYKLNEVAPYIVMPPYLPFRYAFYANPDWLAGLDADVRDFLLQTAYDLEPDFDAYWAAKRDAEAKVLTTTGGMTEIRLSQAESDRLRDIIYTELWSFIVQNSPDDLGSKLQTAFEAVESR